MDLCCRDTYDRAVIFPATFSVLQTESDGESSCFLIFIDVNKRPEANNLGLFPITGFDISQESLPHFFRHPKLQNRTPSHLGYR